MSGINLVPMPSKATVRMPHLVSIYAKLKLIFVSQNELRPMTITSESGGGLDASLQGCVEALTFPIQSLK